MVKIPLIIFIFLYFFVNIQLRILAVKNHYQLRDAVIENLRLEVEDARFNNERILNEVSKILIIILC